MTGSQSPPDKRKWVIILQIGLEDKCVPDGLLCFKVKKPIPIIMKKLMTIHVLTGWRVKYIVIENCFIINNISHHSEDGENNKLNN